MGDQRFDALARLVSMVSTRRASIAGVVALFAAWLLGQTTSAQRTPGVCRPLGGVCFPGRGLGCCGNASCRQGRCRCGRKQRACGGRCISKNRCCHNRDCPGNRRCHKGRCQRPGGNGRGQCGERKPVNLKTSKKHCGECGNTCAGTATCKQGRCVSGGTYREVRRWNDGGRGEGDWLPTGITVDRAGVLYVANRPGDNVWRFTASGGFVDNWPAGPDPSGIDITPAGVVYVGQLIFRDILTFASTGTPQPLTVNGEGTAWLRGLAVGPSGDIYAAFSNPNFVNTVQHFNPDGTLNAAWDDFDLPNWTAVSPNGDVYVTDEGTNEVVWLSAQGAVKARWGSDVLDRPNGVTVDAAGFVYVVSNENARVLKFTASGGFVGTIGDADNFGNPLDVAVSRTGMVYVTDANNPVEERFIVQLEPA